MVGFSANDATAGAIPAPSVQVLESRPREYPQQVTRA
jgi:hypothetical protein